MHRWSSFYHKRSTTILMYVCMYVCIYACMLRPYHSALSPAA